MITSYHLINDLPWNDYQTAVVAFLSTRVQYLGFSVHSIPFFFPKMDLSLLPDLALLSKRFQIPFLQHFFSVERPSLAQPLSTHLKDYQVADFKSAYHLLCDWMYGWNLGNVQVPTAGNVTDSMEKTVSTCYSVD